ncbi:MAG: CoA-disulfide reductase [Syntrophomonas sp.]|nr:CoA-disulfide reductase [Syntrophomonas sp.]
MGKKVLIVGGVAGGASTAARLRRLDEEAQIIMFERGEDVSFANCGLPYYIGGIIEKRKELIVQTPKSLNKRFNIDVRTFNEVVRIFPSEKKVEVKNLKTQESYQESYDYLVLSPGANPIIPPIPGINLPNVFTIRNVPDSDRVKQYIDMENPSQALIIGGGFIGLEMAENLKEKGLAVTVVEMANQVMAPLDPEMAAFVHHYLKKQGITVKLNNEVTALEGDTRVRKAILKSGEQLEADLIVMGIGVRPETQLAKEAGLAIGSTGGIMVDEYLKTSDPNIFAIGDAIQVRHYVTGNEVLLPLAGPANRQGRLVADNIAGRTAKYPGTQGTSIAKIIDMVVAVTGANEKTLKKLEIEYRTCYLHPASNASYYPGSGDIALKLIFSPEDGKVLGAQAIGYSGVDKRIDVIATAIHGGMTVYDLQELELAYAPPFSSAKDPVNFAGYTAANILNGDNPTVYWNEITELDPDHSIILDVRKTWEYKEGSIPGAINIPVDELRPRLGELPRDKEINIYCLSGIRGYIATRMLQQNGFTKVKNLSGGWLTYVSTVE